MKKILFVDDDLEYLAFVKEILDLEGYDVTIASTVMEGLDLYKKNIYDLVISDLNMKSINGNQFLALLKKLNEQAKVIILTASTKDQDEVNSLDLNASDYIRKPVATSILVKRIEKVFNQDIKPKDKVLRSENEKLRVDLSTRKVYKNDEYVETSELEYNLLTYLLQHKNIILTREEILLKVWRSAEHLVDMRTVDTYVKKLRKKFRLSAIYAIRGRGYEWVE